MQTPKILFVYRRSKDNTEGIKTIFFLKNDFFTVDKNQIRMKFYPYIIHGYKILRNVMQKCWQLRMSADSG